MGSTPGILAFGRHRDLEDNEARDNLVCCCCFLIIILIFFEIRLQCVAQARLELAIHNLPSVTLNA